MSSRGDTMLAVGHTGRSSARSRATGPAVVYRATGQQPWTTPVTGRQNTARPSTRPTTDANGRPTSTSAGPHQARESGEMGTSVKDTQPRRWPESREQLRVTDPTTPNSQRVGSRATWTPSECGLWIPVVGCHGPLGARGGLWQHWVSMGISGGS